MAKLCGAKKRQSPGTCRNPAGWKTDHPGFGRCALHGGKTRNHRAAAEAEQVREHARTLLRRENLVPVTDPLFQLQTLAAEVLALKSIFGDKVEELESWSYTDEADHEEIKALLRAYGEALDRAERILVNMARLDIDARVAKLNEAQANLLIKVVEAVLSSRELGLAKELQATGRTILARELSRVTAEPIEATAVPTASP